MLNEIILICWFGAQETFGKIAETKIVFFRIQKNSKEFVFHFKRTAFIWSRNLCNTAKVFIVNFKQFNAFFFWIKAFIYYLILLTTTFWTVMYIIITITLKQPHINRYAISYLTQLNSEIDWLTYFKDLPMDKYLAHPISPIIIPQDYGQVWMCEITDLISIAYHSYPIKHYPKKS